LTDRLSLWLAVAVLLLAAGLRLWELPTLPPGLHDAEILHLRVSDTVRTGDVRVFYPLGPGQAVDGLYPTVLAITRTLTGSGLVAYRLTSVLFGMVTLALVYTLGVRLFGRVAGLAAMGLMAVTLTATLLSRLVLPETLMPLLVVVVMLALARALPVYRRFSTESTNVLAFATLGIALGLSLYVQPASLMLVLASMAFITYNLLTQRPLSTRRLSYIGFSLLLLLIVALPYLLSSFNQPQIAGGGRLFNLEGGLLGSLANGFASVAFRGDPNPAFNLPERPLFDLVSATLALVGFATCVRYWLQPRFALVLLMTGFLALAAWFSGASPNFVEYGVLLPPLALCFGLGVSLILGSLRPRLRQVAYVGLLVLFSYNLVWLTSDLFQRWPQLQAQQDAYHADLGALAQRIDTLAADLPTVICHERFNLRERAAELNATQRMLMMVNRPRQDVRYVDCKQAFVFPDAGANQQVIIAEPEEINGAHPRIRAWLDLGEVLEDADVPPGSVIQLSIERVLADEMGKFTTIAPAAYSIETGELAGDVVAPPVRFGGNVTWLGYEAMELPIYRSGDIVTVLNYWRIEGPPPPDLVFFTHVLSDPVTIVAQRDLLSVDATRLQDRDILLQVTYIELPQALSQGTYGLATGAYQWTSRERLDVLADDETRGDRLLLYGLEVVPRR